MTTGYLDYYISRFILKRIERPYNVDGAPFKIGQNIRVLDNPNYDETFDSEYSGQIGQVIFLEYDCGCGQSFPIDPMIGITFSDGTIAEFWKEELVLLN